MTTEMNMFCLVNIHDNRLYHRVKTKAVYLKCHAIPDTTYVQLIMCQLNAEVKQQ